MFLEIELNLVNIIVCLLSNKHRLTVGSDFGSNYWNRFDPTISTLEIESKFESISIFLKSIRSDSSRFSVPILEIESNCQKIENYIIMSRITILRSV